MKKKGTKLVEALREDYRKLYVKEYTTGWKEQRLIRNIELGIMSLENTERYIFQELDKARREGEIEVLTEIFQTCYQEDSKTRELVEEKLSKLKDNK